MAFRETLTEPKAEGKTAKITAVIEDEDENGVALANLTTVTLTLFEDRSKAIINSRNQTDIKNAGPGVISTTGGNLTLTLTPDDMAILVASNDAERHVAFIEWTYSSGTKSGGHEIAFTVTNLAKVS